ncbi:hypothetical protein [Actinomycetospora straminea]|uniref:Uncharacterized protein n=1 Tax=Actinomycetospora straminea TaxID=663607 RepID=A0ABP9ETD6_9PSEU|nr:hypothetical protein [Actinomycetospora straminea]MDD7933459.1 hypothetical protein [Actinomycetospora straminea]
MALARIDGNVQELGRAADALAGLVEPLRTYAEELRAAQRDVVLGEQQAALIPAPPEGPASVAGAFDRALAANEAAARAVDAAADALPGAPPATTPQSGESGVGAALAGVGNIAASLGNAALQHPASGLAVVGGAALAGVSAVGVVGGTAATATGVGAPVGVPLAGLSAAGVAAGVGLAGAGAIDLTHHALGDDRVEPFRVDEATSTAPFDPPSEITGLTRHADEQASSRDDGRGVSDEAMADAVANPIEPPEYRADRNTYRYKGTDATVVLNEHGRVVTTWAESSKGWRNP